MKDYICGYGTANEGDVISFAQKYFHSGCNVYVVHTDHFYCGTELEADARHMIELRIFDDNSELKISRLNIGVEFNWRYIDDSEFRNKLKYEPDKFLGDFDNRVYDEAHYLDIDSNYTRGCCYTTSGGGKYALPVENAEKVRIRNYLDYDENGMLIISDFRIVGFVQKGDV